MLSAGDMGSESGKIILQLACELPGQNKLRATVEKAAGSLQYSNVYTALPDSRFIREAGVRTYNRHSSEITCLLKLEGGRLVSGDSSGCLVMWNSLYPPQSVELQGHDSSVLELVKSGSDRFISFDTRTLKVWDSYNGDLKQTIVVEYDLMQAICFNDDIFIVSSRKEFRKYIEHEYLERLETKKVILSAFKYGEIAPLWERDVEVDKYSYMFPLPDGRLLLVKSEFSTSISSGSAEAVMILDPVTGESDATVDELSFLSETVLFSTHEMPIFVRKFGGKFSLAKADGIEIPVSREMNSFLQVSEPILFIGPGILDESNSSNLVFTGSEMLKKTFREIQSDCDAAIQAGRYLLLIRTGKVRKLLVSDLLAENQLVFSVKTSMEDIYSAVSVDENTIAFISENNVLEILDLNKGVLLSFPCLGHRNYSDLGFIQRLDEETIVTAGADCSLQVIDLKERYARHYFNEYEHIETVLGARKQLLVTANYSFELVIYDTEVCEVLWILKGLNETAEGLIWIQDDLLGGWTESDGLIVWNMATGKKYFSFNMKGYGFTGVIVLSDGRLLCWGGKNDGSFDWSESKVVLVDMITGSEKELLTIRENRDTLTGAILFKKVNAIVGQCIQLADGRILIPPHWGLPYGDKNSFDMISIDPDNPEDMYCIPLDGYLPAWIQELSGNRIAVCTSYWAPDESKQESRVLFRDAATGESIYDSPVLNDMVREIIKVSDNVIGGLQDEGVVSLFDTDDTVKYLGDFPFDELLNKYEGFIESNRCSREIGSVGRLLSMPGHTSNVDNRWVYFWSRYLNTSLVEIDGENTIVILKNDDVTVYPGRLPLEDVYLFENAIVFITEDGRIGFLKRNTEFV